MSPHVHHKPPSPCRLALPWRMAVWLGLTFNCCRCHDHKFDPLSQRDYYQLFAFFNNTPVDGGGGDPQTKPVLEVANDEQQAQGKQGA